MYRQIMCHFRRFTRSLLLVVLFLTTWLPFPIRVAHTGPLTGPAGAPQLYVFPASVRPGATVYVSGHDCAVATWHTLTSCANNLLSNDNN
jgi:hypothetical protein